MKRASVRRLSKPLTIVALLLAYVAGYGLLSASGQYRVRWSGMTRWGFGLAVSDTAYWFPKGMESWERTTIDGRQVRDANWLAKIYLPLVILDQRWIHPSQPLFDAP